jgi:hypothetical protein
MRFPEKPRMVPALRRAKFSFAGEIEQGEHLPLAIPFALNHKCLASHNELLTSAMITETIVRMARGFTTYSRKGSFG